MNMGIRHLVVAALLAPVTTPLALVAPPTAGAETRVVDDNEGEIETGYSIETARFSVGQKRVVFFGRYDHPMTRRSVGGISVLMGADGSGDGRGAFSVDLGRGPNAEWEFMNLVTAEYPRCNWTHVINGRRNYVKIVLPAKCFKGERRFQKMYFQVESYNRSFSRKDTVDSEVEVQRG